MADEPQVITIIRIIFEVFWVILKLNFEIGKAIFTWFVPPQPKNVSEEIVLITGAGHGIGREMAVRFGKLGATVICIDINPAGNDETFKMLMDQNSKVHKYVCDVTDRAGVFKLQENISREVGDVTILVNNAGIMPCKPLLKHTEKDIRSQMEINVNGNLWMIQAFLPSMLDNNHGHIVALSSMAGRMGIRNLVPYCGTKYAVRGIMNALAQELHEDPKRTDGIKFTTVYPYIVDTGLCHKPRIRFENLMKPVSPGDAADQIINAVRRDYKEITLPSDLYYSSKFIDMLPDGAQLVMYDFTQTGVDAHE